MCYRIICLDAWHNCAINRYNTTGNVLIYGQYGMKSSFGGWQNWHTNNVYGYVCSCYGEGADDIYESNHCIARSGGGCYFWPTYASDAPTRNGPAPANFRVGNNTVYHDKPIMVGAHENISLVDWVASGHDRGTTAQPLLSDVALVHRVRALLHAGLAQATDVGDVD